MEVLKLLLFEGLIGSVMSIQMVMQKRVQTKKPMESVLSGAAKFAGKSGQEAVQKVVQKAVRKAMAMGLARKFVAKLGLPSRKQPALQSQWYGHGGCQKLVHVREPHDLKDAGVNFFERILLPVWFDLVRRAWRMQAMSAQQEYRGKQTKKTRE